MVSETIGERGFGAWMLLVVIALAAIGSSIGTMKAQRQAYFAEAFKDTEVRARMAAYLDAHLNCEKTQATIGMDGCASSDLALRNHAGGAIGARDSELEFHIGKVRFRLLCVQAEPFKVRVQTLRRIGDRETFRSVWRAELPTCLVR